MKIMIWNNPLMKVKVSIGFKINITILKFPAHVLSGCYNEALAGVNGVNLPMITSQASTVGLPPRGVTGWVRGQ